MAKRTENIFLKQLSTRNEICFTVGCVVAMLLACIVTESMSLMTLIYLTPLLFLSVLFFKYSAALSYVLLAAPLSSLILLVVCVFNNRESIKFDIFSFTIIVFLVMSVVFAVLAPLSKPNALFGIRTHYTMDDEEIWKKTHGFMSSAETATIPFLFMLVFFLSGEMRMLAGVVFVLLPLFFALAYSSEIGAAKERTQKIKDGE